MTTNELVPVEPEVLDPPVLSTREAKALDKKIRATSDRAVTSVETLYELLGQAIDGQIHVGLGLKSWSAWFKDAVHLEVADRIDRKMFVQIMSGKGMSQRAIGGALGVSDTTVKRDQDESGASSEAPDTEGVDGKTYKRNAKDDNIIDIPPEDVSEEPSGVMKAVDIVTEFDDETVNLWNAWSAMQDLQAETLWPKATKRIAKADLNTLGEVIKGVQDIIDVLMEA